jgi:hypothetical protein
MNGKKIHNDVGCNKNIIKIKWSRENHVTKVICRTDPLPPMMEESITELGGRKREMFTGSGVVWFEALESMTHSISEGGIWCVIVLKMLANNCWSHKLWQAV